MPSAWPIQCIPAAGVVYVKITCAPGRSFRAHRLCECYQRKRSVEVCQPWLKCSEFYENGVGRTIRPLFCGTYSFWVKVRSFLSCTRALLFLVLPEMFAHFLLSLTWVVCVVTWAAREQTHKVEVKHTIFLCVRFRAAPFKMRYRSPTCPNVNSFPLV